MAVNAFRVYDTYSAAEDARKALWSIKANAENYDVYYGVHVLALAESTPDATGYVLAEHDVKTQQIIKYL